jgi:hypothetical protein
VAEGYSTYYVPMARAMRAIDPSIRLTAVGGFDEVSGQASWNETVLNAAWQDIDITNVDITHAPLDRVTTDFVYTLPAHSATTVEISLK